MNKTPDVTIHDPTELPSHQMATMTMNSALADYFNQLEALLLDLASLYDQAELASKPDLADAAEQ